MLTSCPALEMAPSMLMGNRITWPLNMATEPPEKITCENCGKWRQLWEQAPCKNTCFKLFRNLDAWIILHQEDSIDLCSPNAFLIQGPLKYCILCGIVKHSGLWFPGLTSYPNLPPSGSPSQHQLLLPCTGFYMTRTSTDLKKLAIELKNKIRKKT